MKTDDCSSIFAKLSEYLDQDLPPVDCEELQRHIQSCEPCVAFVNSLKKSVALGSAYVPATHPSPLSPDVKQALKEAYDRMLAERNKK